MILRDQSYCKYFLSDRKVLTMLQTESLNRSRYCFFRSDNRVIGFVVYSVKNVYTLLWLIYRITASFQEIPANWISIIVLTSHILCYANSVVNPFIYNFMSGVYKKYPNLFIITYIFVEVKIQSLFLCLLFHQQMMQSSMKECGLLVPWF